MPRSGYITQPSLGRPPGSSPGFALLITITLVAFLVLILVSLAALTRVETTVASNSQQVAQARQNALMALNIAMGQLQKYAGPDQRTTAQADIDATLAADSTKNGRWTGVYGSRVAVNYQDTPDTIAGKFTAAYAAAESLSPPDPIAAKGSQAILLNWLVSGNESAPFDARAGADVATDGHITLDTSPALTHKPTDTVDLTSASASPATTVSAVLLVGPGSASEDTDRVTAPLVEIKVPDSTLPAFSSSSAGMQTIGRYAWWVGDEGIKARINLPMSSATPSAYSFGTAQRTAVELITDIGTSYAPDSPAVPKLMATKQLPMIDPDAATQLDAARKLHVHDLSAHSVSLLADSYAGGLKKDLSALLATGATTPADTDYLFEPAPGATNFVPTWGQLRAYVGQRTQPLGAPGDPLPVTLPDATHPGINPVMTFVETAFEYYVQGTDINIAIIPRIVLWNPYTRPLEAKRYEFGITLVNNGWFQLQGRTPPATAWEPMEPERSISYMGQTSGPASFFRFIVSTGQLAPGESRVYTLGSTAPYNAAYGSAPQNTLTENRFLSNHYAYISTGLTWNSGDDYQVTGTPSAGHNLYGNTTAYLGLDPADPDYSETNPTPNVWPGPASRKWYQSFYTGSAGTNPTIVQPQLNTIPGLSPWGIQIQYSFQSKYLAIASPRARMGSILFQGFRGVGASQGTNINTAFNPASDNQRASSGIGLDAYAGNPVENTLFEFLPEDQALLSIGQLQHANLSSDMNMPAYAIGNSLAPYIHLNPNLTDRNQLFRSRTTGVGGGSSPSSIYIGGFYDISYLLNRAIWDRYFVSTVPHAGTAGGSDMTIPPILPNSRHVRAPAYTDAGMQDADKAAANLLLVGGFNVNSTSEYAWRAVLGGLNQIAYATSGTTDGPTDAAFSRFMDPPDAITPVSGDPSWAFKGYRRLSAAQIAEFAKLMVLEVRNRGPFISLADFVNRRLKDNPATTAANGQPNADESIQGAIQSAIENAPTSGTTSINNSRDTAPFNTGSNVNGGGQLDLLVVRGGPTSTVATADAPHGSAPTYAAQYLSQADVLSRIGATLVARSDTFTIRTYGEVQNPVTNEITGRAWCEAVVQRVVEPLSRKSTDASSPDYNEPAAATATQPDLGRRFEIISFRWLSSSDI